MGGLIMNVKKEQTEVKKVLELVKRIETRNPYKEDNKAIYIKRLLDVDKDLYFQQHTFNH